MPDGQLLRQLGDAPGEAAPIPDHDGPGGRRAALAGGDEGGEQDVVGGFLEIGVGEDEGGVLAAHLQREDLRLPQVRFLDGLADGPAADEEDAVHSGMRGQGGADGRAALDEVEDAARDARLLQAARVDLGGVRGHVAGLEDDGVAAGQRGKDVPVGEVDGEVERPEHGEDAVGTEPALGARLPRRWEPGDQLQSFVGGDGRLGAAGLGFGSRFPERLADVEGDGASQLLLALLQHRADPPHELGPVALRNGSERALRGARRLDGRVDLRHGPGMAAQHEGEVRRRPVLDDPVGRPRWGPAACDEVHLLEGYRMQPFAVLRFQRLDGGLRDLRLGVAEGAERPHGAKPVPALAALDGDQSLLDVGRRGLGPLGEALPGELGPPEAADRLDQLRRRGVVRAAVEGVDALVVAEADARQHRLGAHALRPHLADGLLDLLREQRHVDLARREELLDELLVLPGEPVGVLVGEPGELAAQRLPERAAAVLLQPGKQLHQDAVAEAGAVHGDVEEADVAELLAGLALSAEVRVDHQAADLGRAVEVVADGEHHVPEMAVDAVRVVFLLVDVEEDVRRVAGAVLGDDQRRPYQPAGPGLLHHEDVLALEGVADAPVEGARRLLQDGAQFPLVVGQVDGVELGRELPQSRQIALLDVADHVQAQSSRSKDSYRSHALSNCAISMRSSGVCALPVLRPGPITIASHPARAKTPASVLVGLAWGAGSRPWRARTAPADLTSGESFGSDMPEALRSVEIRSSRSPPPSSATQACASAWNRATRASGSCPGKRRPSSWMDTAPSPASRTFRPPTAPGGSKRGSLPGGIVRCQSSYRAEAVASARQRFGWEGRGGRNFVAAGCGSPFSRGAGTSTVQLAGTTFVPEPPLAAITAEPDDFTQASVFKIAFSPRCGVELCAALPANNSCSTPGPSVLTGRALRSRMVQRTTAYPLCAEMIRSSLGSPQRTWVGAISRNRSLCAKWRAPRSPTSSPNVPRSQNGRFALRPWTLRAASALQSASSFTSATPRPWSDPSRSVSVQGSPCHRSSGPGGTVSR